MSTLTIWKRFAFAWLAAIGLAAEARAQQPEPATTPPVGEQRGPQPPATERPPLEPPTDRGLEQPATPPDPRPQFLPVFELTGKSDGEGTVRIGVDLLVPFASKLNELRVKMLLEAASHDGFTTILEGTSDGFETASTVAGALDLTYTTLQKVPRFDKQTIISADPRELRRELRNCPAKDREAAEASRDLRQLDERSFCREAQEKILEAENEEKLPLPKRQLAFSFSVGRSAFSYLSPTDDPMVLSPTSVSKPWFAASIRHAQYAATERLSLELATSLQSSYEASSRKARWCTPVGSVRTDAAESCFEMRLGAPTRTTTLAAAAYVGLVGDDYNWRVAMGPTTRFDFGGDEVAYEVGFELPFYLVRSSAGFAGIVRVAPAALLTRDADGAEDTKVLLTLTLLGNRTLFETAFR